MRHFDAHAYRTEDADGVWDFARGCMRTYLILKEKAAALRATTPRSRRRWPTAKATELAEPTVARRARPDALDAVAHGSFDVDALAAQGYGHERLDQLVTELLLGVR